jgi:hypothetical protein
MATAAHRARDRGASRDRRSLSKSGRDRGAAARRMGTATAGKTGHLLQCRYLSSTFFAHYSMHSKTSAISLSLNQLPLPSPRLASNLPGGTQSDPTISSIARSTMITISNSPFKGSGMLNQRGGDLLHTMAGF